MHCWSQVQQIDSMTVDPERPLPAAYFHVSNNLLYYCFQCRGELADLLVVAGSKTTVILHLAHTYLLGGHLGPRDPVEKICIRFHWPWIVAKTQILPVLRPVSVHFTAPPCARPTGPTAHHRGPHQVNWDGSCRAAPEVHPRSQLHPGGHGLCNTLPRGVVTMESDLPEHHKGAGATIQQSGHPQRHLDVPRHPFILLATIAVSCPISPW